MKFNDQHIREIAKNNGLQFSILKAFIATETGGKGFDDNGKIIIQFEPHWFKRKAPFAPSGKWSINKVDRQAAEWIAFNDAFAKNANAAMESTSIGLGQIMGFHYKRIGYETVGAMWEDAKRGEYQQVLQMVRFIITDGRLYGAMRSRDYHLIATYYNGAGYKALAKKYKREPYNLTLERFDKLFSA